MDGWTWCYFLLICLFFYILMLCFLSLRKDNRKIPGAVGERASGNELVNQNDEEQWYLNVTNDIGGGAQSG